MSQPRDVEPRRPTGFRHPGAREDQLQTPKPEPSASRARGPELQIPPGRNCVSTLLWRPQIVVPPAGAVLRHDETDRIVPTCRAASTSVVVRSAVFARQVRVNLRIVD